ncbi:MAG: DUF1289 domain-containing protein [Bacteroidales bacterium]|nr:DUF1289 domain-containing protein [Bacteroidales bacterium]
MPVPSPCKLICRYDSDGLCAGCRRTREEITRWISYSDHEKLEVYKKITLRKQSVSNVQHHG